MNHVLLGACIAVAALFTQHATADPPRDISAEIAAHRAEFVSAKVYRTNSLEPKGCYYQASGTGLSILLNEVIAAGLHEPAPVPDGVEHTAIYLATRDGRTVTLRLTASDAASTALLDYMDRHIQISPSEPCGDSIHIFTH